MIAQAGTSGSSGSTGTSGTSGSSGSSGTRGSSGSSGSSGQTGASGSSGSSGSSGQTGAAGSSGSSGSSGQTGAAGSSGSSGQTGGSGSSGTSGSSGSSGTRGSSGSSGSSGQTGGAGSSGSSGSSGQSGAAGSSGTSGAGVSIANNIDNYVLTATGSGINGEANLRFDGTNLGIGGSGAYPLDVIQTGGGSGTVTATLMRAGNNSDYYGNNQILFGYSGTATYMHAIKSRHNSANLDGNALDFYTWQNGQSISAVGTFHVMTIENNATRPRVGIGTSTPTNTLDVRGNFLLKGDATDGGIFTITRRYSTGPQTINFNNNHPSSNLDWTGARITSADAGNYNGYLDFSVSLGNNGGETAGTAAVASVMRLTKDKRVGIGTISPSKTLHVFTTDNEGIYLQGSGGGVWMDMQASGGQIHSIGAQVGGMGIYNRTSNLYRFFITDTGNVGIGTASPSLHSSTTGLVVRGSARGIIELWDATSGKSVFQNVGGDTYIGQLDKGTGGGATYVLVNGNGSTADIAMTLLANSNVGIGISSPFSRLHVRDTNTVEGTIAIGHGTFPSLIYSSASSGEFRFDNRSSAAAGFITFYPNGEGSTLGSEAVRITTNRALLVGTTSTTSTAAGKIVNRTSGSSNPDLGLNGGGWSIASIGGEPALYLSSNIAASTGVGGASQTAKGGIGFEYVSSSAPTDLVIGIFGTPTVASSVRIFNQVERIRVLNDQGASTPTSYMKIATGGIIWGGNNSGKEINSCQISAGYHQSNSMNLVGMSSGTGSSDRRIDFWVEGGAFFRGAITATGDVTAFGSTSDIRLKKNIIPIDGALGTIMKVNGYTFQWNENAPVEKRDKTEYGVIAQEVEAAGLDLLIRDYVRPVNETGGDDTPPEIWKSVQYEKFVPVLIEAIKEQQGQIEELKKALFNIIDSK